jgi:hypothetical protein
MVASNNWIPRNWGEKGVQFQKNKIKNNNAVFVLGVHLTHVFVFNDG